MREECHTLFGFDLVESDHRLLHPSSYPNLLHINRGNHEAKSMNCKYHFQDECFAKYDRALYSDIQDLFNHLPLCTGALLALRTHTLTH